MKTEETLTDEIGRCKLHIITNMPIGTKNFKITHHVRRNNAKDCCDHRLCLP